MLRITQSASRRLTDLVSSRPHVTAVRLTCPNGDLRCRPGKHKARDLVIETGDHPPIFLSPKVATLLSSRTLDAPDKGRGPRLQLLPETLADK